MLRSRLRSISHRLGFVGLVRHCSREFPRALYYHRFCTKERSLAPEFERQCEHLARFYKPISEKQFRAWVMDGAPLPRNAVLLTVDDGYADFYEIALPILRRYEIPALVFVTSGLVNSRLWLWFDRLEYAIEHAAVSEVRSEGITVRTGSAVERASAFDCLAGMLKTMQDDAKEQMLREITARLEVEMPARTPNYFRGLTWTQLRKAASSNVTIGGHCRKHSILTRLAGYDAVVDEVAGGKRDLETGLGLNIHSFAYPNGMGQDYDEVSLRVVREAGFKLGFLAMPGFLNRAENPLALRRIPMDLHCHDEYFRQLVAGFRVPRPRRAERRAGEPRLVPARQAQRAGHS